MQAHYTPNCDFPLDVTKVLSVHTELLLERIRSALKEISDSQLGIDKEQSAAGQKKPL